MSSQFFLINKSFVGAHLITTPNHNYLLGTRTGIHQDLIAMKTGLDFNSRSPDTVLMSDLTVKDRVSCRDLEFVFLAALFLGMDFANGQTCSRLFDFKSRKVLRKFRVVIERGDEESVINQLEPSLLGASRGFLKNNCRLNKDLWQMLSSEANFFNLKDADGKILQIEDLVEIRYWNDRGEIILEDGMMFKKTSNLGDFEVHDLVEGVLLKTSVDFHSEAAQPVWTIPQSPKPFSFSDVSIVPLGTSSPFNVTEPPTGYWLKLGARGNYLIDCGFFTDQVFERNGGSIQTLNGLILTHCHGDHFNPIPFLYRGKPLELWTSVENYKLAQKITCAKAGITPEEFQRHFEFKEVKAMYPGFQAPRYKFGLLELEFHYSIHPIPTLGVSLYHEDKKLVVFSSDMVDLKFIKETMLANGVIPPERAQMIFERFDQQNHPETLFLVDCGGDGFIHGKAGGYSMFFHDTTKVVECHRSSRKPDETIQMHLAEPLSLIQFLAFNDEARITAMICQLLADLGIDYIVDWAVKLKETAKVLNVSAKQPLVIETARTKSEFYLVDFGRCRSSTGLYFESGNWFGEESLLGETEYVTSIFSDSPARILVLDAKIVAQVFEQGGDRGRAAGQVLRKKFRFRNALGLTRMFVNLKLPVSMIDDIAVDITPERFADGEIVYRKGQVDEGHMYIVEDGVAHIDLGDGRYAEKLKNDVIGELVASGDRQTRSADVRAKTPLLLIKVPRTTFQRLLQDARVFRRLLEIKNSYVSA